ncbi:MAG: biopolymer transporter ExbD [Crocinitomicaceae bacterium]|nr:biopolymer transporter ExbD [Crocinitomicaceae bacterium]
MSKFKKDNSKEAPAVNTSSLPDIVFMLLFFFMVATTSKESDPTVSLNQPDGVKTQDMTPFKQRSEIDFLYIGTPRNKARIDQFAGGYALFLDNVAQPNPGELYNATAVRQWKMDKFEAKPKSLRVGIEGVITCVKADVNAPVGVVFDIRKELQDIEALKIAYAVQDNSGI